MMNIDPNRLSRDNSEIFEQLIFDERPLRQNCNFPKQRIHNLTYLSVSLIDHGFPKGAVLNHFSVLIVS